MHLHAWRKERAAQRGMDSSLIIPKNTLWAIAEHAPRTMEALAQIQGMGAWRQAQYGAELLALTTKWKK
jgi:ribonuclease D